MTPPFPAIGENVCSSQQNAFHEITTAHHQEHLFMPNTHTFIARCACVRHTVSTEPSKHKCCRWTSSPGRQLSTVELSTDLGSSTRRITRTRADALPPRCLTTAARRCPRARPSRTSVHACAALGVSHCCRPSWGHRNARACVAAALRSPGCAACLLTAGCASTWRRQWRRQRQKRRQKAMRSARRRAA